MAYNALSLIGDFMIGPLAAAGALPAFFYPPINATKLTLNPGKVDQITRIGKGRTTNGTALNVMTKAGEAATFTVENDEFRAEILAMQLRGTVEKLSEGAATATDESMVVMLDHWVQLNDDHWGDGAITITADPGPTPAYTENTHFIANRRLGMIKFLSGVANGPADNAPVLVDYPKAAHSLTRVNGSIVLPSRYAIKYDGINQATGKNCVLYARQAVIAPDGNLDLVTEAFVKGNLVITPELVPGQLSAYRYDEDD